MWMVQQLISICCSQVSLRHTRRLHKDPWGWRLCELVYQEKFFRRAVASDSEGPITQQKRPYTWLDILPDSRMILPSWVLTMCQHVPDSKSFCWNLTPMVTPTTPLSTMPALYTKYLYKKMNVKIVIFICYLIVWRRCSNSEYFDCQLDHTTINLVDQLFIHLSLLFFHALKYICLTI